MNQLISILESFLANEHEKLINGEELLLEFPENRDLDSYCSRVVYQFNHKLNDKYTICISHEIKNKKRAIGIIKNREETEEEIFLVKESEHCIIKAYTCSNNQVIVYRLEINIDKVKVPNINENNLLNILVDSWREYVIDNNFSYHMDDILKRDLNRKLEYHESI